MTTPHVHPQQERENPEPSEATNPAPLFVILVVIGLFVFGALYIAGTSFTGEPAWGDARTLADLQGPAPAAPGAAIDGSAVYASRCIACHQAGGTGLSGVFPPLAESEWVVGDETTLVALVLHGISGPLTVKGKSYDGAMPAFAGQLQDAEIAAVLSHIRSQWGNSAEPVAAATVATVRSDTATRSTPFAGDAELGAAK